MTIIEIKDFNPQTEREAETLLCLKNGYIGTRNSLEEHYSLISDPGTFMAGFYDKSIDRDYDELVRLPDWTFAQIFVEEQMLDLQSCKTISHNRYLDIENCHSKRVWVVEDIFSRKTEVEIIKFVSFYDKHIAGQKIVVRPLNYSAYINIKTGIDSRIINYATTESKFDETRDYIGCEIFSENSNRKALIGQRSKLKMPEGQYFFKKTFLLETQYKEDIVYESFSFQGVLGKEYEVSTVNLFYDDSEDMIFSCGSKLGSFGENFFEESFVNHKRAWKEAFEFSRIIIEGEPHLQKWIDFSIYQLLTAGQFSGNKFSIPARDLTGEAYKGHVFWDTEIYVLPFFVLTNPEIAKNLLMYRYNTLDGARKNARIAKKRGAFFAWESTDTGIETTPQFVVMPNGKTMRIYSGDCEYHISFDIAWAVWFYYEFTEDIEFLKNYGAEIIIETARFAISIAYKEEGEDGSGFYHINRVVGPDEYHELVDDNFFTNKMADFTVSKAVEVINMLKIDYHNDYKRLKEKINLQLEEIETFRDASGNFYFNKKDGIYEQFKGFFDLKFIDVKKYEPRFAPMDMILGEALTKNSQVIKQPDVLMAMFILLEEFTDSEIRDNFDYYEKRCGHGSSLSAGIHSIMAAKSGAIDSAYHYFEKTVKVDLENEMGNAAGGIHIAAQGDIYLILLRGFIGMRFINQTISLEPRLPKSMNSIEFNFVFKGGKNNVKVDNKTIFIKAKKPLDIIIHGKMYRVVDEITI